MKQSLKLFILLLTIGLGMASIGNAARYGGFYTEPTLSAPPGNNAEVEPINTSEQLQAKGGSLTVTTFVNEGGAIIQGETFFKGYLYGGVPLGNTTPIAFGDISNPTSIEATGTIGIAYPQQVPLERLTFQSDTLIPQQGSWSYVCADSEGTLTTDCPDMCPNIDGVQPTIPLDMSINPQTGNCDLELTVNAPTSCQYQMIARKLDDTHAKFTLEPIGQDGTPYLYSPTTGSNIMSIVIKFENGAMRTLSAPQGQIASYDFGAVTNHIRILGVLPGTINGREVCWRGY